MSTSIDVKSMTTAKLVEFYNIHNPSKPIKKFSDRATAERRCAALAESLISANSASNGHLDGQTAKSEPNSRLDGQTAKSGVEMTPEVDGADASPAAPVPAPVVHKARALKAKPAEPNTDDMSDEEYEAYVKSSLDAGGEDEKDTGNGVQSRKSNAAGIAASWNRADVAEKRLTRNGVRVEGHGEFKSVRVAFAALNLPDSKHIRFRMKLKEAKSATFEWAGKAYTFHIED